MRAPDGAVRTVDVGGLTVAVPIGETAAPPPTAARRTAGVWVLVLAAVLALVVRAVMAPGIPGSAVAVPIPLPPAVGSCVVQDGSEFTVVPCDTPHTGEIAMSWAAGEPARPPTTARAVWADFSMTRALPGTDADLTCRDWTENYLGWTAYLAQHRGELWLRPRPLAVGTLIAAPPGQGLPDRHWTACLARTADPLYTGTMRDAAGDYEQSRPDAVSVCLTTTHARVVFPECTKAHTVELLGSVPLTQQMMVDRTAAVELTRDQIRQQCESFAATVMGSSDPTHGGQLAVLTEPVWWQSGQPAATTWFPDCLVKLVGQGELVGSLVGLGDGPLPIQR